jgi:hypothetical protein
VVASAGVHEGDTSDEPDGGRSPRQRRSGRSGWGRRLRGPRGRGDGDGDGGVGVREPRRPSPGSDEDAAEVELEETDE